MNSLSRGYITRMTADKAFGFIKIGKMDYFFHRDHYNGKWQDLQEAYFNIGKDDRIYVTCEIVDSAKGPRVENVSKVEE